jgi:hypothetical protein
MTNERRGGAVLARQQFISQKRELYLLRQIISQKRELYLLRQIQFGARDNWLAESGRGGTAKAI